MKNIQNTNLQERIALLIISITLLILFLGVFKNKESNTPSLQEVESTEESSIVCNETEEETQSSRESEVVVQDYPKPEYAFTTDEVTIAIKGLSREYTIAWVSDLHLVSDHKAGEALGDVHAEYLDAIDRRYEGLAVTSDGVHAEDLWPEIVKYLNYNKFDGVIFGGDMMDYCSNSNVAMIKEGLDNLRIPYIYIRADHDYGAYYGGVFFTETQARQLHQTIDGDAISYKFWDDGDFLVLGIDNSTKDMPDYYLDMVTDVYSRGKPVIMATHVPYDTKVDDTLKELSMQVRNTIYYWSDESDQYKPNDVTRKYLDMVYDENTVVSQVLAGHLHASWDGMISAQVSQHIFAPAFSGSIGIIHVVPEADWYIQCDFDEN